MRAVRPGERLAAGSPRAHPGNIQGARASDLLLALFRALRSIYGRLASDAETGVDPHPSTQIAPQARQNAASTPGRVTQAFSLQLPQTCRSSSLNQASMSTLDEPASVNFPTNVDKSLLSAYGPLGPSQRPRAT